MEYLFERETQFLQFTPISFIDKVIDLANRQAHYSLDRLQDYIDEQIGECPENERGMQMAATLLEALVDKNFDRWELYCLQKVFSLPPTARLPLAPGLPVQLPGVPDHPVSEEEDKEMNRQLEFYQQQLKSVRLLRLYVLIANQRRRRAQIQLWRDRLNAKLAQTTRRKNDMLVQESALRFLHEGRQGSTGTVSDQIEFVCSQIEELQAIFERAKQFDSPIEELHSRYNHYRSVQKQRQLQAGPTVSSALLEDELYDRYKSSMSNIKALLS